MSRIKFVVMGLVMGAALVIAPAVAVPTSAPQAQAAHEDVRNDIESTRNISVRIWEKGAIVPLDVVLGPNSAINAGTDRISSYYIPKRVCAVILRGGVPAGTKRGPDRVGLAQGERITTVAFSC